MGWLLGLGLLGGIWYGRKYGWPWSAQTPALDDQAVTRATQDLLAFFNTNRGITLSSTNDTSLIEQNARIRAFQAAWNRNEMPKLRTDGIWDSTTANVFRQLTGYSPPPVQAQTTSGYLPLG